MRQIWVGCCWRMSSGSKKEAGGGATRGRGWKENDASTAVRRWVPSPTIRLEDVNEHPIQGQEKGLKGCLTISISQRRTRINVYELHVSPTPKQRFSLPVTTCAAYIAHFVCARSPQNHTERSISRKASTHNVEFPEKCLLLLVSIESEAAAGAVLCSRELHFIS